MAKCADLIEIEPPLKSASGIRSVQQFKLVHHKAHVAAPRIQQRGRDLFFSIIANQIGIVRGGSLDYLAVRQDHRKGSKRSVEADDYVAVTCQIFSER